MNIASTEVKKLNVTNIMVAHNKDVKLKCNLSVRFIYTGYFVNFKR